MSNNVLFNFHSHNHYCDGKGTIEEQILSAIEKGFGAFGVSSHAPLSFPCDWAMEAKKLPDYLSEVNLLKQKYQDQIAVFCGLEIDYIPNISTVSNYKHQLDYTIGSVHFIDTFADGIPWEIDGNHTLFLKGLHEIFQDDIFAVIHRYFELTRAMVVEDCPDVIGHLDKLFIQNRKTPLFDPNHPEIVEEIEGTLQVIAESGAIIEVNTRGLYKKLTNEPYPSFATLQKILERKIPITLSSDSHHPREIAGLFPETNQQLKEIGFKEVHRLTRIGWEPIEI